MNLYLHIPFCASRCTYCDFYTQTGSRSRSSFLQALRQELHLRRSELPPGEVIQHIYLGGGTPSLLTIEELDTLFEAIAQDYPTDFSGEITIECNPDDVTRDYARGLAELPINRVSMGVQSFFEEDLHFLNRRHSSAQVYEAISHLRQAGISELSIDLIYGLPHQTLPKWEANVQRFLDLELPHLSAYHLIYEEGTAMARLVELGKIQPVSEAESVSFFRLLMERLAHAGYEHYEISNFALPAHYARHNTGYWLGEPYLGLGPAAHSFDGKCTRAYNRPSLRDYITSLERGELPQELEQLSTEELQHEYILTRLRTQWGISLGAYAKRFGQEATQTLLRLATPHLERQTLHIQQEHLRLTPEGVFISDGIMADLFV